MSTYYLTLIIIAGGSLLVSLVWLMTRPTRFKVLHAYKRPVVIVHSMCMFMHVISGLLFPLPIGFDIIIRSFGLAIFVSGVYIAIWAKYTMGLSWSHPLDHAFESNHRLVTHGPFAYSRNPIYLSVILMNFGTAIALKSAFIFLVFVQYNQMLMTILQEEEHLLTRYGKQFESYMQKVSRLI